MYLCVYKKEDDTYMYISYTYMNTCVYAKYHVYIYMYMYTHVHEGIHTYISNPVQNEDDKCMHAYVYTYIYIYIQAYAYT